MWATTLLMFASCTPSLERGRLLNVSVPTGSSGPYAERPVLIFLPKASGRRPALLTLHGYGSDPITNLQATGLVLDGGVKGTAVEYSWIVAAPYGSAPGGPTGCQSYRSPCAWNAGGWSTAAAANRSDVAFLSRVALYLAEHACAFADGTFATGFSAGAMMAQRLACEAPDVFRGVAPMEGSLILGGDEFRACAPRQQVGGWLSFCGSADGVCQKAEYGSLGQNATFSLWGTNCTSGPAPTFITATTHCEAFAGCPGHALIERCLILGLGHHISGHAGQGEPATDVDAVRYALERLSLTIPTSAWENDGASDGRLQKSWLPSSTRRSGGAVTPSAQVRASSNAKVLRNHSVVPTTTTPLPTPHAPRAAPTGSTVPPSNLLSLRLLTDAHSRQLDARCLDGSPAGYYYRRGVGRSASRFLLVLVGSGWCSSLASCTQRATTAIGGSTTWEQAVHGYGIANASAAANPDFCNWSVAYVATCDGAFFLGDAPEPVHRLYFRGRAIVDAVVHDLVAREGLAGASALLVTGESSGGLAAALSVDRIAALLPAVDVRAVADAAFFLDCPACGGDRASLAPIAELAHLNTSLRAATGCRLTELWKCASLPYALPSIRSPVFLTQVRAQSNGVGAAGCCVALTHAAAVGRCLAGCIRLQPAWRGRRRAWLHSSIDDQHLELACVQRHRHGTASSVWRRDGCTARARDPRLECAPTRIFRHRLHRARAHPVRPVLGRQAAVALGERGMGGTRTVWSERRCRHRGVVFQQER
jgi:poly(3-hydroxybutyrate) depolymerase